MTSRALATLAAVAALGACHRQPTTASGAAGWSFCGPFLPGADRKDALTGARNQADFQEGCQRLPKRPPLHRLPDPAGYRITQVFPSAESPTGPFLPMGSMAYLHGTISCAAAGTAHFAIESENPYSLWLDGEPVFAATTALDHNETRLLPLRDADVVTLPCGAGARSLVVRLTGLSAASRFWLYPVSPAAATTIAARRVLTQPDALGVTRHETEGLKVTVEPRLAKLLSDGGAPLRIIQRRALRDEATGYEGVEVEVTAGKDAVIRAVAPALPKSAAAPPPDPAHPHELPRARLALLAASPRNASVEASAARTLVELVDAPGGRRPPGKTAAAAPGSSGRFTLASYRAAVDGSVQTYGVIPNPGATRTLVALSSYRPSSCIESSPAGYLSENSDELERLALLARQAGWAVVMPRLRNAQGLLLAGADLDEVLADAGARFGLPARTLVLAGRNMGGTEALMLASRFPGRFAGVAAISPLFDPIAETCSGRWTNDDARPWFAVNTPGAVAEALAHTPVLVVAEGPRLETAEALAAKVTAAGGSMVVASTRKLEARADGSDPLARMLAMLPPPRPALSGAGARATSMPAGPGPLHAIFTAPVRVVVGDTPADAGNAASLARAWQRRRGGALPAPAALVAGEVPEGNLVLVAGRLPSPWDRAAARIEIGGDHFTVGGRRYPNAGKALAFIARRPDGKPGDVMVVSSRHPLAQATLEVLLDGFHDYYVLEPSANHVVERGYLTTPGEAPGPRRLAARTEPKEQSRRAVALP